MDDRITDVEIRLAFLERTLEELDAVVRDLAGEIDRLRHEMGSVAQRVDGLAERPRGPEDEVPPHY